MEFEFKGDGTMRYANNSMYRGDGIIRKKGDESWTSSGPTAYTTILAQPLFLMQLSRKFAASFGTARSSSSCAAVPVCERLSPCVFAQGG
jgi:hypothetical protein